MKESLEPLKMIPYGFVVTRSWLSSKKLDRHTIDNWVKSGQVVSLVPGVFARPDSKLTWQGVVCSFQRMGTKLAPGGLTAMELQGFGHYLAFAKNKDVYLYGPDKMPTWVNKILPGVRFVHHKSQKLFGNGKFQNEIYDVQEKYHNKTKSLDRFSHDVNWGLDDWPIIVSTPERALFELLLDVPEHVSFEHTDQLMQSLTNLSPNRLNWLLSHCKNVKVKRLFLWFAERHNHSWTKKLQLEKYNMKSGMLGFGKRLLAKGGKLDFKYLITVPEELYGTK